ncbi:MAG: TonB-dependent receptor, partial [Minicystis sp.]
YFSVGAQAVTPFKFIVPGRFVYGTEFRLEDIAQPRTLFSTDKGTGKVTEKELAGAIPRSRYDVTSAFLLAELRPSNRVTFSGGLRFETTGFKSSPDAIDAIAPFTTKDITVDKRWNSVVWSVGPVFALTDELSIAANVGTGFRVPTPFELVLTQVQGNVTGVSTIPSTTLEPVKSMTVEGGPRWVSKHFKSSFTGYYTKLDKLIGFVNTPITIDIPGVGVVPTRRNENSLDGFIVGFESYVEAQLPSLPELTVFGNLTYTFGWDEQRDVPLRGIPPINGIAGVRWESRPRRWWTEAVVHLAARKTAVAPEEKTDQAFATDPGLGSPNATTNPPLDPKFEIPGYAVLNLRGGVTVWRSGERNINVMGAINNVFNTSYRPAFASIKEAPGVGADLAVKAAF